METPTNILKQADKEELLKTINKHEPVKETATTLFYNLKH